MKLHIYKLKDSLNKAYLKLPLTRSQIDDFKANFNHLIKQVKKSEGEEFHKNAISEFLKKTYYSPNHYINTKGHNDLVIHNDKDSNSTVGVIIECKSPSNVSDMPTVDNLNSKAIHELILYYLRERITNKNLELKHLIVTNLFEWFIFDAHEFEKHFGNNNALIKKFTDFEEGRSSGKDTSFFYKSIASPLFEDREFEINFTHLDLRNFEKTVENNNLENDNKLIPLYKIFSPEHLIKLKFKNDSNSLDKDFYRELLHIIGLEETKQAGKKVISRASEKTRNYGSLIEGVISILKAEDLILQIPRLDDFGDNRDEQYFNISLELVITWINRILFLKLLESQLFKYNQRSKNFKFLNQTIVPGYDSLNKLFFQVLAIPENEREASLKDKFKNIPYLNSSLFESTDLERKTIRVSNLDDESRLLIFKRTVLKDNLGKKIKGDKSTFNYLFEFLDAYNFSSEGEKGIQEENKTLINASVLGLIFEKINGYKDGSFFTPGYITQYMCHETITKAVVQKFNEAKGWNCKTLVDTYNKIENKKEANSIINSLRICDPAVGSGHFLVSALNEIISLKSELKILIDKEGRVLRDYHFEVINDELNISCNDGEPFEYNPKNPESQRVQETLFHEKQTIIENCLFGVDINPNSVKICRLRLWIELLKHSYYKPKTLDSELETLPNIDINIKCGNSLINRHPIDANIKSALKSSKWTIDNYREAVMTYRNADNKTQKRGIEDLISKIKADFAIEVSRTNPDVKALNKKKNELLHLTGIQLFDYDDRQKKTWRNKLNVIKSNIEILESKISEIKNNKIFQNAFEWRFEFPEVLNDSGDYIGFDVIIGNPPYGVSIKGQEREFLNKDLGKVPDFEIYYWFINKGNQLLNANGTLSYIIPNTILFNLFAKNYRLSLFDNWSFNELLDCTDFNIFIDATVRNLIIMLQKSTNSLEVKYRSTKNAKCFSDLIKNPLQVLPKEIFENNNQNWGLIFKQDDKTKELISKIKTGKLLSDYYDVSQGYIPYRTSDLIKKYGKEKGKKISKERMWHSQTKLNKDYKQEIFGRDISKYGYKKSDSFVWYGKHLACYVDPRYFKSKRILIREITNPTIIACLIKEEFVNDPQLINVINKPKQNLSLELLWAIFNSKVATFFHFNASPKATKGAFPKILINDLNNFPLPKRISKNSESAIIKLVTEILKNKKVNPNIDIADLEYKLNNIVYKLYLLDKNDIDFIELQH